MTHHPKRFRALLKANLIAGILFVIPLVGTYFALHVLLKWVDKILLLIPAPYRPENFLPFPVPGIGLLLLLLVLLVVGFFVRNFIGREMVRLWDSLVGRIPLVSKLYGAFKQLMETIFTTRKDFKKVVLVEYPRHGIYAIGFVTADGVPEVQDKLGQEMLNVFVPTTPNPTSGYFVVTPVKDIIPLDMSVEDAFKLVISAGIVNPAANAADKPPLKEACE